MDFKIDDKVKTFSKEEIMLSMIKKYGPLDTETILSFYKTINEDWAPYLNKECVITSVSDNFFICLFDNHLFKIEKGLIKKISPQLELEF